MTPTYLVITKVPPPGSPLNAALAGPIYLDPQATGGSIDWEHDTPMQLIGDAMGNRALHLWLRTDVFRLGEVLITNGEREVVGAGRRPDKWGVEYEQFDDIDKAIARAHEVSRIDVEPFT